MAKDLTQKGFNEFISLLSKDPDEAARKYLSLHERLIKFFEWRDCENAEELTDIVFDRVVGKISGGEKIKNPEAFAVGIAKFVLMENRRASLKTRQLDDDSPELKAIPEKEKEDDDADEKSKDLQCLDECLKELPEEKRKLVISYFDTDEETLISTRKRLAEKLNLSLNSLRIRVCRLKSKLEKCVKTCCEAT